MTEGDPRKMATDNIETSTNDGTKENHNDKGELILLFKNKTSVIPEGLSRGVPIIYAHFVSYVKSHVIGGK